MKTYIFLLVILVLFSFHTYGQKNDTPLKKEKYLINDSIGYAEAVKVGNTIYISGSVGWGKMDDALKIVYDQLGNILKNYHASFANVVKENLYTLALDSVIKYNKIRLSYYKNDYPAATWVEVKRLYNPDLVLEVEIIAVLPDNK